MTAPERIWLNPEGHWSLFDDSDIRRHPSVEYIRADLVQSQIDAAVKRALEAAAMAADAQAAPVVGTPYSVGGRVFSDAIRAISADPEAIAKIIGDA